MTKIGAGTMVLSGTAISFNGNVTVSAGTLVAYNAVAADGLGFSTGYGAYNPNPAASANGQYHHDQFRRRVGDVRRHHERMVHVRQLHRRRQHFAGHHRRDDGSPATASSGRRATASCRSAATPARQHNGWETWTILGASSLGCVWMAMTGGTIDIEGGTIRNGGWQAADWTINLASMNIAAGATVRPLGGPGGVYRRPDRQRLRHQRLRPGKHP